MQDRRGDKYATRGGIMRAYATAAAHDLPFAGQHAEMTSHDA